MKKKQLQLRLFYTLILPVFLYCLNRIYLQQAIGGKLLTGYLNDLLAPVILLALVDWYRRFLGIKKFRNLVLFNFYTVLVAGCVWEFVTPFWRQGSTIDAYDLVAYFCGYLVYTLIYKVFDRDSVGITRRDLDLQKEARL